MTTLVPTQVVGGFPVPLLPPLPYLLDSKTTSITILSLLIGYQLASDTSTNLPDFPQHSMH